MIQGTISNLAVFIRRSRDADRIVGSKSLFCNQTQKYQRNRHEVHDRRFSALSRANQPKPVGHNVRATDHSTSSPTLPALFSRMIEGSSSEVIISIQLFKRHTLGTFHQMQAIISIVSSILLSGSWLELTGESTISTCWSHDAFVNVIPAAADDPGIGISSRDSE